MSVTWININERLLQGISLINSINTDQFTILLRQLTKSKSDNNVFTPEYIEQLGQSFRLNPSEVKILLQCLSYIFKQSCKVILKPTILQKQLVECLHFKHGNAEEFVKLWTTTAKEDFDDFKNRNRLGEVSWEVNIQTASTCSKEVTPNARVKFGTTKIGDNSKENIVIELNQEELTQMYNTFENIQKELDVLQSNNLK